MERIFITGADGLLGCNTVNELLLGNYKIRVLLERDRKSQYFDNERIEVVYGDILNYHDIDENVKDCDYIIHMAAITNLWPSRSKHIRRVNVLGTKNVIKAALKNNINRMIFVGTANSFGSGTKNKPGNELNEFTAKKYKLDYIDSKYRAYRLVKRAVRKKGLPCIIVNPTFMLGPYDSKPSSGKVIKMIYKRKVPGYTSGGRNLVHVQDVACAIVNALKMGRVGEAYILGNKNMSYKECFQLIADIIDVNPPRIYFYSWMTIFYGLFNELLSFFTGKAPSISYPMARISCDEHYYSSEKAINELNLPQTDIKLAISDSFNWMKDNGYLN